MCLSHTDLIQYYKVNFALIQHYRYSLQDIESMIPWEREVYVGMLITHLKKKADKQQSKQ